jgi:hypothetical protein
VITGAAAAIDQVRARLAERRAARLAPEHEAATALGWGAAPPLALPGLEIEWLGTAGFRLTAGGTTVLIDPYVSRPGVRDVALARPLRASTALIDRHVPRADAVLVGHTHFDHALDVPTIARRDGSTVYGSRSLHHLMGLHGLAAAAVQVEPHRPYEIGPFTVAFVPSRHSRLLAGVAVPSGGELTCDHLDHLNGRAYNCGQVWGITIDVAGLTLYHQGSADLLDDARLPATSTCSCAASPAARSRAAICSASSRASSPRWLCPTTGTTSSPRSTARSASAST